MRVSAFIAWKPPAACHVDPAVSSSRSISATSVMPRSVRWYSTLQPTMPPPITTTWYRSFTLRRASEQGFGARSVSTPERRPVTTGRPELHVIARDRAFPGSLEDELRPLEGLDGVDEVEGLSVAGHLALRANLDLPRSAFETQEPVAFHPRRQWGSLTDGESIPRVFGDLEAVGEPVSTIALRIDRQRVRARLCVVFERAEGRRRLQLLGRQRGRRSGGTEFGRRSIACLRGPHRQLDPRCVAGD